jgi:hypothetical protein
MRAVRRSSKQALFLVVGLLTFILVGLSSPAFSQNKSEKTFTVVITDSQGVETEMRNALFYWEEKVSDTAFVPHELKHVPVKRGSATVNVKFDGIKTIEMKPTRDKSLPLLSISLANGNSAEFALAIPGSFKGMSDFGETELSATAIHKILFK